MAQWATTNGRFTMASISRLGKQIEEIIATLNAMGARFALIGGLALASHKVIRATQDVDLLTDADIADPIDKAFTKLGYTCLHRSAEVANYARGDERVDFLFASRPISRRILARALEHSTSFGVLRVISAEGLIELENDRISVSGPKQPLAGAGGIVATVQCERDPYEVLDDLMSVIEALCPTWPARGISFASGKFLL
jgi:hypothetical protein